MPNVPFSNGPGSRAVWSLCTRGARWLAHRASLLAVIAAAGAAHAQSPQPQGQLQPPSPATTSTQPPTPADVVLDPMVVTATRERVRSFDAPAAVSTIDAATIQGGNPMVNLSETLVRVPGIVANNRQNYAQDLQISSRGFGARAQFGVRGIRLFQDDIPQTMPDGQGQAGSFMLLATDRIEVLRGPFSTLYGNASGGVISLFTEQGVAPPSADASLGFGSFGARTVAAKANGASGSASYVVAASHFETDGFRDHSAASRDLGVIKLALDLAPRTKLTLLGNLQSQPESQDPLGLTRAQWEADPRQADPAATTFDTRKSITQKQLGAAIDHALDDATALKAVVYLGERGVRQYLALPGTAPTSSGGVSDLDSSYGGASLRVTRTLAPSTSLIAGIEYDAQQQARKGFVNNNGDLGDLRRSEDDDVTSTAAYAQVNWLIVPGLSLTAGLRANEVAFDSYDHYVTADNPDDSGSRRYRRVTPVAGAVWHASDALNLYASYGQGFETPTFIELAYRSDGPGLNFGLAPATSDAYEVGAKYEPARGHRVDLAVFQVNTDNEIVVDASAGGRTTYRNAGSTRRRGAEVEYQGDFGAGWRAHLALAWLDAVFTDPISTGSPPVVLPAGNKLPGVPDYTAYGELAWTPPKLPWLTLAAELHASGKIYVNDRNSDAAPAYTVGNLRVGVAQTLGGIDWRAFARLDNVTDRNYIGSVIVGDTNGRYFEPAPGRNWFAGVSAHASF